MWFNASAARLVRECEFSIPEVKCHCNFSGKNIVRRLMEHNELPLLIFSNTKIDSDLRHILGTHVPDDMAVLCMNGRTIALASALEINRLKSESRADEFISWDVVKSSMDSDKITECDVLIRFLRDLGIEKFSVKRNFPVYFADNLRAAGFGIAVFGAEILPQRLVKSDFEIGEISTAIGIVGKVFASVETILANSSIGEKGELVFENEVLTSERLRATMEDMCYRLGAIAEDTIVACGDGACDPHNVGHGPLMANAFILIDFFPRLRSSGYYADISRTFIKGRPSKAQHDLYNAVKFAHDTAIASVHDGVSVREVTEKVFAYFESNGYESSKISDPPHGMFHSLGHGFGLDIHEPPRVGICDGVLESGMVITIEPGLYYRGLGGVRIEDDVLVGEKSASVLSKIPYNWTIE
ncbi:MAG: Xaa-Pro peptidase family protein [Puniceicoccales bacterium]|jgi:Xaa-Pro aminopeptidase|nr:Xaa-Pro peptidase family protein [Puniceicoccales bacterium]